MKLFEKFADKSFLKKAVDSIVEFASAETSLLQASIAKEQKNESSTHPAPGRR